MSTGGITIDDALRILCATEETAPAIYDAVRTLRGIVATDDELYERADRFYEAHRMSAHEVRSLRDTARAAQLRYEDATAWCRCDAAEMVNTALGWLPKCIGCGQPAFGKAEANARARHQEAAL